MTKRSDFSRTLRRKRILLPLIIMVLIVAATTISLTAFDRRAGAPLTTVRQKGHVVTPSPTQPVTAAPQASAFDKARYSTTDPASLWVVVNKTHPLSPIDYAPSDIMTLHGRPVSARMRTDLDALFVAAGKDGIGLTLVSGYRSYDYQKQLYASYAAQDGTDKADTYSARAGFSEHQTGLAVDFGDESGSCLVEDCYGDRPEAKWLAANAYKYGFLLRYTADNRDQTGYQAEAWHYRYVGTDLTTELRTQNITTLEQFFGISGGSTYQ